MPTSDGVAYTAQLHLDAIPIGVAENDGTAVPPSMSPQAPVCSRGGT
jgi:hypothetical protein